MCVLRVQKVVSGWLYHHTHCHIISLTGRLWMALNPNSPEQLYKCVCYTYSMSSLSTSRAPQRGARATVSSCAYKCAHVSVCPSCVCMYIYTATTHRKIVVSCRFFWGGGSPACMTMMIMGMLASREGHETIARWAWVGHVKISRSPSIPPPPPHRHTLYTYPPFSRPSLIKPCSLTS
jgi:hypothetical protein